MLGTLSIGNGVRQTLNRWKYTTESCQNGLNNCTTLINF